VGVIDIADFNAAAAGQRILGDDPLTQQAGQGVSPQGLIQITPGPDTDHVEAGALLRLLIRSLRRKLGYPVGEMGCIENVRGVGSRLIASDD
jgi:DNA-binding response OmpR family regulator